MALNLNLTKKKLYERYKERYDYLKTEKALTKSEINKRVEDVINQELPEIEYREDFTFENVDYTYLKPSEALVKKAFKTVKEIYLNSMATGGEYRNFSYWNIYYSYTKVVKGMVIRYQFNYFIDSKNRSIVGAEGNQFNLLIAFDYKHSRGIWNEKLQYSGMAGYVYKPTYHSLVHPYCYDKKHDEGGMRWGHYEYARSYEKLRINPYFSIGTGNRNPYSSQRLLELNPNHVEMLYKLGYVNLWDKRIADKKVEFLKKHMKELRKDITLNELSKAYVLDKKGLKIKDLDTVLWFINNFYFEPYKYDFDSKYYRTSNSFNYYGKLKGTKTEDLTKIIRMMNLTKEFGLEHLVTCRGVCYYFNMDFESFIFKGLKERQAVIAEWEEQKHQHKLKERREYEKQRRKAAKEAKLRTVFFDDFCKDNEVVYKKHGTDSYHIYSINGMPIEKDLNTTYTTVAELYEEEKALYNFKNNNEIVVTGTKGDFTLVSVNGREINKRIIGDDIKEVKRVYDDFIYKEKLSKVSLEDVTKKYQDLHIGGFVFKPLRTMQEFQEIQDNMLLCLMRNEYYQKVKGEKIVLYIAHEENQDKLKGEVIEFKIENNTIKPGQISGYDNKSTPNYDAIKQIAYQLTMDQLIQKGA